MADRGPVYGLDKELAEKNASKYDLELESQLCAWMEAVTGSPLVPDRQPGADELHASLKDGVYLCKLLNSLQPGTIRKVHENTKMAFKQMENIGNFLTACSNVFGVPANESFQTVDLFENQNMRQVLICIQSLARQVHSRPDYAGPVCEGLPRMAEKNVREFDEATMNQGKFVASQQMGNNLGATQKGMSPYGKSREIVTDNS
eukprot:Nk52_evm1s1843 gene=Nk52_evmTU1s1843